MKRVACISGGGSLGAYYVGVLSSLYVTYFYVVGVSTGALMSVFIFIKDYFTLTKVYTSVKQKDIFNLNPINEKGKLKWYYFLLLFLLPTIGITKNLKKLIDKYFKISVWLKAKSLEGDVIVGVHNKNLHKIEYKNLKSFSFAEFKDWVWVSANAFLIMSLIKKGEYYYEDGGTSEVLPLTKAVNLKEIKIIDVFIHRTMSDILLGKKTHLKIKNGINNLEYFLLCNRLEIEKNDLINGLKSAYIKDIKLKLYFLPEEMKKFKSFVFKPSEMIEMFNLGKKHAFNKKNIISLNSKEEILNFLNRYYPDK